MDRFSISKWIHLNSGDDGLTAFFRRVHAVLKPGGTFVLEPQAWDTYSKAKRMNLVSFEYWLLSYAPNANSTSETERKRKEIGSSP